MDILKKIEPLKIEPIVLEPIKSVFDFSNKKEEDRFNFLKIGLDNL